MTPLKPSGLSARSGERGVSLLLALIFCAFFGAILVTMARYGASEGRQTEARVAGWELVQIAKAARLYVRDQWAVNPAFKTAAAIPSRITMATLKAGGYLPAGFGRVNGVNDISALNQEIYVILANWSPSGLGGALTSSTTIPSAFVYFRDGGKSSANLVLELVNNARRFGATLTAPLFDFVGVNRSAICRGAGPAISIWDTGCMTQNEFATIAGAIGVPAVFVGGGVILPAWKAVQPDLRAVMRFPQPENPGFATMLTDLQMGTPSGDTNPLDNDPCTGNHVFMTTLDAAGNPATTDSGVCKTLDDDAAINRRYNIDRVGNLTTQRIIAAAQTADFGGESAAPIIGTANDEVMQITGDAALSSDLRVFNVKALPAGVTHRFNVPNGTVLGERNAYIYSQNLARRGIATMTSASANSIFTDALTTSNFNSLNAGTTPGSNPSLNVTSVANINGPLTVNGGGASELITETFNAANGNVHATDTTGQVQITGTLAMHGTAMSVGNAAPMTDSSGNTYSAVFGDITGASEITAANTQLLSSSGSISAHATLNTNRIDTVRCLEGSKVTGACPNRQYVQPNITP